LQKAPYTFRHNLCLITTPASPYGPTGSSYSLNPPLNSNSPNLYPQSDAKGKSEKAAAQNFTSLPRQEKHYFFFIIGVVVCMICYCLVIHTKQELYL